MVTQQKPSAVYEGPTKGTHDPLNWPHAIHNTRLQNTKHNKGMSKMAVGPE